MNFTTGDFVKDEKGNVGKVTGSSSMGVYVFNARSGQNGFFMNAEPVTKEEYDAQVEERLHPKPKPKAQVPTIKPAQPTQKKTFRWLCLECGNKYNGRVCPRCDGEDRILNSEDDYDPSYIGGVRAEPYAPGE